VGKDHIEEDQIYAMHFDPDTEEYTEFTDDQLIAFQFFQTQAAQIRSKDNKKEPTPIKAMSWLKEERGRASHLSSHQI
jgi:hypothetical protein